MRLMSVSITNFKALTTVELPDLGDVVVVAGPNGCGKSCILDALRLLKSAYGGYQPNEFDQWFGEFQIPTTGMASDFASLAQDQSRSVTVAARISLSDSEKEYIRSHAAELITSPKWQDGDGPYARARLSAAARLRARDTEIQEALKSLPAILNALDQPHIEARIELRPDGQLYIVRSDLLELVFSVYLPQHIGIIDYHGAARTYNREQVGGINLALEEAEQRLRQHALYNHTNKYNNLKSEMAASYIRGLLASQAGRSRESADVLTSTLHDLFATFFPGKTFLGPQPTPEGGLLFQVRTQSGAVHDINELSSGEKEILYGYLRLRSAAPRDSVLLLDEPELHLNPRLLSGLAGFYHKHLGAPLNNQLWLVTHSDTLIREAVNSAGFRVFHLQPASDPPLKNQATLVSAADELERVIIDLVGDLAAYRPGARIVVFEGAGDDPVDVRLVGSLFPDFITHVNAISSGNKHSVRQLYRLLNVARESGAVPGKLFAIVDRDDALESSQDETREVLMWDVYHIENYLLHGAYIHAALTDLNIITPDTSSAQAVEEQLLECARNEIGRLVVHKLQGYADRLLRESTQLRVSPLAVDAGRAIHESLASARARFESLLSDLLTLDGLEKRRRDETEALALALEDGTWKSTFRGRDVLKRFVQRHGCGLSYEMFRDLVISKMRAAGYRPAGMAHVLSSITNQR